MALFVPYHNPAGQLTIVKLGVLTTEFLEPPPGRCFLFRRTYRHTVERPVPEKLRNLINRPDRPKGPPPHLHQFQPDYFREESGVLRIEVNRVIRRIMPGDGEISVKAGSIYRFFIYPDSLESMTVYLSASSSGNDYQLDLIFSRTDWIQFLAIQDEGDAYTPTPAWGSIPTSSWLQDLRDYRTADPEPAGVKPFLICVLTGSNRQPNSPSES
ncbi:uncharacterized protein ATNIH1004_005540 [Aspergillus tanneri]|uniref:Uncharacterized protein n=1 Tax=Aspergillus tanneri TaxID=1220188 RepID=A0A5M9MIM5_9EURO|nr:uncharacterized protein ATNIH1004_005540 [Aspergillus tanneri]KAA8646865.1 hypothetical protein ATNIH1004_005540 [Aspergillus tanneri]